MFENIVNKFIGNRYDIVPPQLAIKAMRSSGFKGTDQAVAELIDNSIQSGIEIGKDCTDVEVICIEEPQFIGTRTTSRISQIAVYDNAAGMDAETLRYAMMFGVGARLEEKNQKGIGKFGMGLPNASISQCRNVEVYSWKNGETFSTFMNIDQIIDGSIHEVPEPEKTELPEHWRSVIKSPIGESGTLVIWTELDRATWRRHKAFFNNTEFLIGRMYRHFIQNGSTKVRLAAYSQSGGLNRKMEMDTYVRPNDPLMLLEKSMAPSPFDKMAAFVEFGEPDIIVVQKPDGSAGKVQIRYSLAADETRNTEAGDAGHSDIGKFLAKNLGVSIVRADRELELNLTWNNPSEPRERWWGIEISFGPELDDILGVTNDKQAATKLFRCDMAEDAKNENISKSELIENLTEAMDPRLASYQISQAIAKRLSTIRAHIKKQNEGKRTAARGSSSGNDAEGFASRATQRRIEKTGQKTGTDFEYESSTDDEKAKAIEVQLIESGVDSGNAHEIAVSTVSNQIRYLFTNTKLNSPSIFDIEQERGTYFIKLNTSHPAHEHFIEILRSEDNDSEEEVVEDSAALKGLKLLLTAWARMEAESTEQEVEKLQEVRYNWGRIARDFIRESTGEATD